MYQDTTYNTKGGQKNMSRIKVQVSKKMAAELNKALKGNYCIERIYYSVCGIHTYGIRVRSFYSDHYDLDYDYKKGTYKYLTVEYTQDCYAMNTYITTYDLQKIMKENNINDFDDFVKCFKREYEI